MASLSIMICYLLHHALLQPASNTEGPLILLALHLWPGTFPTRSRTYCPLQWWVLTKDHQGKPEASYKGKIDRGCLFVVETDCACVCVCMLCVWLVWWLWKPSVSSEGSPLPWAPALNTGCRWLALSLSLFMGMWYGEADRVHDSPVLSPPCLPQELLFWQDVWPKIRWVKIKGSISRLCLCEASGPLEAARLIDPPCPPALTSHIRHPREFWIEEASQWAVHWRYFPTTVIASWIVWQPSAQCAYQCSLQFTKRHF